MDDKLKKICGKDETSNKSKKIDGKDKKNNDSKKMNIKGKGHILEETDLLMESADIVSGKQLSRMIYVEGFGAAGLSYPYAAASAVRGEGIAAFIGYAGLLLLFSVWMLWMSRLWATGRGGRLISASKAGRDIRQLPAWAAIFYVFRYFVNVILLTSFFCLSIREVYMPDHSLWQLMLPLALLMCYCAQTTLQKHARFLELLFPWIAGLFAVLIIAGLAGIVTKLPDTAAFTKFIGGVAAPAYNIGNQGMSHYQIMVDMARGGYVLLLCSIPLEFIFLLVPFVSPITRTCTRSDEVSGRLRVDGQFFSWKRACSCVIRGVAGGFCCNLLLWFVTVKTLGTALTASTPLSVIKIMQLVHLPGGFLERFDIILIVYWILCVAGVLSGYLYYGRRIAEEAFFRKWSDEKKKKHMTIGTVITVALVYAIVCSLGRFYNPERMFHLLLTYRKWVDLPLILLLPFLLVIYRFRTYCNTSFNRHSHKMLLFLLLALLSLAVTGCRKQSDAEKKRYILSLYVEGDDMGYRFRLADADLNKVGEKGEWIPCRLRDIREKSLREMEKAYRETEVGEPEWNHISTILIGSSLAEKPDKLLAFLREWERAWSKSPNVTVCLCTIPADTLYKRKGLPDGAMGQMIEDLVDQAERPGVISRTPIDLLKRVNDGETSLKMYRAESRDGEVGIREVSLRIPTKSAKSLLYRSVGVCYTLF